MHVELKGEDGGGLVHLGVLIWVVGVDDGWQSSLKGGRCGDLDVICVHTQGMHRLPVPVLHLFWILKFVTVIAESKPRPDLSSGNHNWKIRWVYSTS